MMRRERFEGESDGNFHKKRHHRASANPPAIIAEHHDRTPSRREFQEAPIEQIVT